MVDGGDDFELSFGQLRNLDDSSGPRPFSADHKFGGLRHPLHIVRSIVGSFLQMFDYLRGIGGLHYY